MSTAYYTLGGDYSRADRVQVFTTTVLLLDGNYDVREFPASGVGFAARNNDGGSDVVFFQSSSSIASDLFYSSGGYFFDFSDNTDRANLTGGDFRDFLYSGTGDDILTGGGGNDMLDGGAGADILRGGLGNDFYRLDDEGFGVDVIEDAGGIDTIMTTDVDNDPNLSQVEYLEVENLTLLGSATTGIGNGLANVITGNAGDNWLDGKGGRDTLRGGLGNDRYDLGFEASGTDKVIDTGGFDTIASLISRSLVFADYREIEGLMLDGYGDISGTGNALGNTIIGSLGDNLLSGAGGSDRLYGSMGDDTIKGGIGNDTIDGGPGVDLLFGQLGNDFFRFSAGALTRTNRDTIADFNKFGNDTIQLDSAIFLRIGPPGALNPALFKLSRQVQDTNDRIIYNQTTGQLFYDRDASGPANPLHFATLQNKPVVTAADFQVI